MNWKIAIKELAVSGSEYMTAFRHKNRLGLVRGLVFGNKDLVTRLMRECSEDIAVAPDVDSLMDEMNARSLYGLTIDREAMTATIRAWDSMIARGPAYHNDDQLRRIASARAYRGDRARTCNFQSILDPRARPLIAIREFILSRKSLGGIQTDLQCRVLRASDGQSVPGLYAVGEAAGFGGGGIHGKGSLEGTFLGGCVLSGRLAGRSIGK
jgi:predicted oxidoreductase